MPSFTNSHPDAEAFLARVLAHPTDRLTRLVFADWLDETGRGPNAAWAEYIRLRAHLAEAIDPAVTARAEEVGRGVKAEWSLPGLPSEPQLGWLTELLPDHRIRVRFGETRIPQAVVELMPESVAREHAVMPIAVRGLTVYLAYPHATALSTPPDDRTTTFDTPRKRLEFILNRDVVLFGVDVEDVSGAINRHFGQTEIESVGGMLRFDSPMF
jgi:uncharacterized protein (TIGR02996 family)